MASGVRRPADSGLIDAVRIGLQWDEYVRRRIGLKTGGHDSDHRGGLASDIDGPSQQPRIAGKAIFPKRVTEDDDFGSARRSSCAVKVRPMAGAAPKTRK